MSTIIPWSPSALSDWLSRFDALTQEMQARGDRQSLLVAAVMHGLRAGIASTGCGDERQLREMAEASFLLSQRFLEEQQRLEESEPS